ncbi:DNA polymerase III subunit gamma/tau [Marinobacter hydrocarbonoclasticus]|nr:DNA polymerase III subunit gamma/tau [Marinobacter nauticus]
MSYQVLARKWRPASFDQVVGQEHVLKALTHALEQNRLHHAYLFTGTRGVGKTSIARLLAKGLNCETGITATPCGQCSHCREISEGRFVDLLEIDAASRTKVDDTREILDNVQYQPVRGRFKVYLIDEVHMLSRHSFNALLKTLEEPPPHVKFLLATTDPQKLPVTVLSRCLQFNLKSVPVARISAHLANVLEADKVPFEPAALDLLAKAADGSVRDGMSLTDQAIAHGGGQLQLASVQAMLGTLDTSYALRLLNGLAQGQAAALMAVLDEVEAFAPDHDDLLKQMAAMLHQVALCQFNLRAAELGEQATEVLALAQQLDREQVQLWYQMLTQGRQDLALAPDPRSGFEMVLLRALAFAPLNPAPPMAAPQPQLGAVSPTAASSAGTTGAAPAAKAVVSETVAPAVSPSQAVPGATSLEPTTPQAETESPVAPAAVAQPQPDAAPAQAKAEAGSETETSADDNEEIGALAAEQAAILAQADQARSDQTPAPPVAQTPQDQPADETALAAEQDLILSQAQSQHAEVDYGMMPDSDDDDAGAMMDSYAAFAAGQTESATTVEHAPSAPAQPVATPGGGIEGLLEQALANHRNIQARLDDAQEDTPDPKPEAVSAKDTVQPTERTKPTPSPSAVQAEPPAAPVVEPKAQAPAETVAEADDNDPPPWVVDDAAQGDNVSPVAATPEPATDNHSAQVAETSTPSEPPAQPQPRAQTARPAEVVDLDAVRKRGIASNETDAFWYQTMAQLGIGARPRQLAINSVLERDGDSVRLHLRAEQRHLNSESVIGPLKESMERVWGQNIDLQILEDVLPDRETPLEIRRRLHQERLVQAREDLLQDPVIQWLQSEFDARLIEESVSYQNPG